MPSSHLDKLVRSFVSGASNPYVKYDKFDDTQDPTYLTFNLDFFPDNGYSFPDDVYSMGGLFRKFDATVGGTAGGNLSSDNNLYDSAAEYLCRIGAPNRQIYLELFTDLLRKIQTRAPWYFQSITGVGDLFKLDPANNYRGKDKELTIECLESVDLRMSLLADLYRNMAFDFEFMREVLPINLRTFNMAVHVLEFRKFNTTWGIIADYMANRNPMGQSNQNDIAQALSRHNVYGSGTTSLFSGTGNNLGRISTAFNNATGGLFTNLGNQAGGENPYPGNLQEAFEAISVQTFLLKGCEFDFYSEAPGYLDALSVKDIPEATFRFKIKVRKIQKLGNYAFDDFVIAEYTKNSRIPPNFIKGLDDPRMANFRESPHYYEQNNSKGAPDIGHFSDLRESIFPSEKSQIESYIEQVNKEDRLRVSPLERNLRNVVGNATSSLNNALNNALGNATGGIIGNRPLGNVYDNPIALDVVIDTLNNFLDPSTRLPRNNSYQQPASSRNGSILKGQNVFTDRARGGDSSYQQPDNEKDGSVLKGQNVYSSDRSSYQQPDNEKDGSILKGKNVFEK